MDSLKDDEDIADVDDDDDGGGFVRMSDALPQNPFTVESLNPKGWNGTLNVTLLLLLILSTHKCTLFFFIIGAMQTSWLSPGCCSRLAI